MWREVNITDEKTVYLNRDAMATVEDGAGHRAFIHLLDGTEYQTNEDYDEFLALFDIIREPCEPGQKRDKK